MNSSALVIMLSVQIGVSLCLLYFFYRMFKSRNNKSKQNHSQNNA